MHPRYKLYFWLFSWAVVPRAWAQNDMIGPDWLKLLLAFPKLLLFAIGEFALFVAPLFLLLALVSWALGRWGGGVAGRLPGAPVFALLAALTAVPAFIFWQFAPQSTDPAKSYRPTTVKDRKVDPLKPPVGKSWPQNTGYLELPQGAQGGRGTIVVSGSASFRRHYVKLCVSKQVACPGLRHVFLQKHSRFEFRDLPPGDYEVRYLPIDRPTVGGRSQPITVAGYGGESHAVTITDSPVLDSKNPVVGILPGDF